MDQKFVAELCNQWKISFHSSYYDVKKIAKEEGLSEEEAGRKVRYQTFLEICRKNKCNKIAIAHNKNDNAETILFHLVRGTGIKGLTGIEPSRRFDNEFSDIILIRPLLCLERSEIEDYLQKIGVSYQTDSTNLTEDYSRNKIRNRVLAYITEEINTGAINNITGAASQLKEIEDYINKNITMRYQALVQQKERRTYYIPLNEFSLEPIVIQKGIVRKIMEDLAGGSKDLEAKHVDEVLSLGSRQVGRYIHLPYGMIAEREYNGIIFYKNNEKKAEDKRNAAVLPIEIPIPGRVYLAWMQKSLEVKIINYKKNEPIPKNSCEKWFDYDKIENAVEIRTRKEGDYIQINCEGGRKKIKDYFIDQKVPKKIRDHQILITDGSHVMWIPGDMDRMSEKYKVDETTNKILLMKFIDAEEKQ